MSTSRRSSMSRRRGLLPAASLASLILLAFACGGVSPPAAPPTEEPILTIGYWHSFIGYELAFYSDGQVSYMDGSGARWSRLSAAELRRLAEFLGSHVFEESLAWLNDRGYRPRCCDIREVAFVYESQSFGYPVCGTTPAPDAVVSFIDLVNELAATHFGRRYRKPLPTSTCELPAGRGSQSGHQEGEG